MKYPCSSPTDVPHSSLNIIDRVSNRERHFVEPRAYQMGMELLDYDRATVLVCGSLEVSSDVEEWANWSATKSGPILGLVLLLH